MEIAAPPNPPGMQEECKFKNKLQEFAQRASMHLPVYQTFNEGPSHLTKFRSTVIVGGTTVASPCTFHRRREAEQHVAKIALESIGTKIRQETMALIHNDTSFCKIILHEYATKMKMEFPVYTTSKLEGLLPTFSSSVVFDGKTYGGGLGWNKKVAEQIGARTVIEWLLGQSDTWTTMAEIIKSKDRFFNAINREINLIVPHANSIPSEVAIDNRPGDVVALGKDVHGGSILPHDSVAPLKVPVDGHTSVISSILPVSAAEHFTPPAAENPKEERNCDVLPVSISGDTIVPTIGQNNQPEGLPISAAEHFIPPAAENPKERNCDVVSGSISEDTIVPTIGQNNQPEGLPISAAEHFTPPAAENPKERNCDVLPGSISEDTIVPTIGQNNQPEGLPTAENPKERNCDVVPGSISGDTIVPTVGQNNQPEGLPSKHSDHVCNDSYLEQAVQAKTEVASEGPQTSRFHSTIPTTGGKRSHKKNKKRNNSKKPRMGN